MKPVGAILAATLAIALAGCVLKGKPAPVAATPVVPKPAPPATPPAPPPPLSVPQVHPDLPAPQPLSTEALTSAEAPGEPPAPPPAPPRGGSKKGNTPGNRPRDTAPATTPTAPMPAPAAAAPAEPDARPTIQEIVPTEELNRLKLSADSLQAQIRQRLARLPKRGLTREQKSDVDRINSFLSLSEEAERGGDMRKANELAERGMALAQGLPGAR
jgi:hypothetical protein